MKILNYRIFEGRNIYSHKKCIKLEVDLEGYSNIPSKDIKNFNDGILKLMPELKKHRCGIDEEGGFVKRLEEGTYLAHICEHTIIAIHNMVGLDVCYGKAREIHEERYYIIFEYKYPKTAMNIAKLSIDLINALINGSNININNRVILIRNILKDEMIGPSTEAICRVASSRGIPVVNIDNGRIYQLGYGRYGKMIDATIVDGTKSIAVDIACDKLLTKKLLENQCIPVAKGGKVNNSLELLIQAEAIGYPVVLKPQYGNQGKGVFLNIQSEKELLNAYKELRNNFKDLLIEEYVVGNDYRVCMVDDEVVAVSLRVPPYVIGDGKRNLYELIEEINQDDRRGEGHEKPLTKIKIDSKLIKSIMGRGCSLNSILQKGEKLYLRENANLSTGGSAIDCTEKICKENIDICKRIAKTIGLNICGIDICCKDISIPIVKEGIVMEVNAAPGIRMHHYPSVGKDRNVAGAIVDMLFKNSPTSVPVVSITGTNGKTTTTRLIAYTLSLIGYNVGATTTGGIFINNQCVDKGDTTGFDSAKTVLLNKEIDVAVLETARGGIIRNGLGYDLADVAVITNITDDHLGMDGIDTLEDLAKVKSLVIEAVKKEGYAIINGDDPLSRTIINKANGNKIIFSKDKNNDLLKMNMDNGGYGVYIYNNAIYVERKKKIFYIANVEDIPITFNGNLIYNIENALAACAALVGLEVDYCMITKGLTTFLSDEKANPGRFNVYSVNGATVILDYGHNLEGYKAVVSGAKKFNYKRIVGIIGVPGDRLDSNVLDVGKYCGDNFDYIYIKEDRDKRGRKPGEIAEILEKGVISSGKKKNFIEKILDEKEALGKVIDNACEGDLILMFFEEYEPLVQLIKEKQNKSINIKANMA